MKPKTGKGCVKKCPNAMTGGRKAKKTAVKRLIVRKPAVSGMDEIDQVGEGKWGDLASKIGKTAVKAGKTIVKNREKIAKGVKAVAGVAGELSGDDKVKKKLGVATGVTDFLGGLGAQKGRGAVSRATLASNASRRGRGELQNPARMKELTAGLVGNYSIQPTARLMF
jgi:hypothetical protein